MITHHLDDLKNADQILYLDQGKIMEHGTFADLVSAKGKFYRQMEAFVNLVKTGKMDWPSMNLQDAFETMLLAEKISYV